jgi:uncharacterized protein (UPF0210 family)
MNKQSLKLEVEKLAKELNVDFIKAAKAMQSASVAMGDESLIVVLNDLKMENLGL